MQHVLKEGVVEGMQTGARKCFMQFASSCKQLDFPLMHTISRMQEKRQVCRQHHSSLYTSACR